MPKSSKPQTTDLNRTFQQLQRLQPKQLLILIVIAAAILIYTYISQGGQPGSQLQPGDAPATAIFAAQDGQPTPAPTRAAGASRTPGRPTPTRTAGANPTKTKAAPTAASAASAAADALAPASISLPKMSGQFDYLVLSLSWSPDYCATTGTNDTQQCSIGKKLGFVLHGLWPQNNKGYPADCTAELLPAKVKAEFPGLFPSTSLYDHEWEKHGTCTGLSPRDYLSAAALVKQSVIIPTAYRAPAQPFRTTTGELKTAFTQANPGFSADTLAVSCSGSGRYLKELLVCFTREGQPRACSAEVQNTAQKSCGQPNFLVRNIK